LQMIMSRIRFTVLDGSEYQHDIGTLLDLAQSQIGPVPSEVFRGSHGGLAMGRRRGRRATDSLSPG